MPHLPASFLRLNDDVLADIVSYLDSTDARQLSRTARRIHAIADHHALQFITLRSFLDVVKFCTCMLEAKRYRLLSLRELRIHALILPPARVASTSSDDRERAALLADLLQEASKLQVFTLHSAEYWLQHEPRLGDAVSSLQCLVEIELQILGPETSKIIGRMQSAPRKLVLSEPPADSIEILMFPDRSLPGSLALDVERCMPSVQYLAIMQDTNLPNPTTLARIFPALRSLHIQSGRAPGTGPVPVVDWPSLERVCGLSYLLARWQNVTPVHLLQLTDLLRSDGPHRTAIARTFASPWDPAPVKALSNFQPVALVAQLDSYFSTPYWHQLLDYTSVSGSHRGSARLRYVSIELGDICARERIEVELDRWWRTIMSAVKASGIICLEVRCPLRHSTQLGRSTGTQTTLEGILPLDDFHTFVARVGHAAPALRYLSLDLSPGGDSPWRYDFLDLEHSPVPNVPSDLRWWSFEGKSTSRVAKSLDVTRGERIAAYLRSTRYDYSSSFKESEIAL